MRKKRLPPVFLITSRAARATTAATRMPTARAVPLSAQLASQSTRDMPAVAAISATMAQTKPMAHTSRALRLRPLTALAGVRGAMPSRGSIFP